MGLSKYSHKSDRVGDLYRAAFYMAKGATAIGLDFLKKSGSKLKGLKLRTKKDRLYWAEKILDEYERRKFKLQNNI